MIDQIRPKKVIALFTELNDPAFKGGIQVFNQFVITALQDLNIDVFPLILNDGHSNDRCIATKRCGQLFFACHALLKSCRHKPDVIINGHIGFSPVCILIKKLLKIPYITITYGKDVWNLTKAQKMGLKDSFRIFTISNYTRNLIIAQLMDYPQNQINLLPNALDSERFKPGNRPEALLRKLGLQSTDKIILSVSRLSKSEKDKGYTKTIAAVKELLGRFPNLKYVLAGSGDDLPRLRNLVKDERLDGVIILPGFISEEELPDYYNLCDLFVLPSKKEGFGFVFLEALACGKPVIAGNKDGSVDAVLGGELGLLINPDNITEIKDAIARVLTNDIPQNMRDKDYLRSRVIQAYGFDSFKNRLRAILS